MMVRMEEREAKAGESVGVVMSERIEFKHLASDSQSGAEGVAVGLIRKL